MGACAASAFMLIGCIPRGEPASASASSSANELPSDSKVGEIGKETGRIVSQPARDVGASKIKIPPILQQAQDDPYTLARTESCASIDAEMAALDEELGPDLTANEETKKENRAGKLAAAGGRTVVNAIIPFRSLIREISGAAPAQRRLNVAADAGYARRGFLNGIRVSKRCPVESQADTAVTK